MSGTDYGSRERLAEMLDNPGERTAVTVVYLRLDGTVLVAQHLSPIRCCFWREGVDYIRGHHADDSEDVQALIVAKKLVGSAETT